MDDKKFGLIVERLLEASHRDSFTCADLITEIVFENLPLIACSFYTFFQDTKHLSLRAQKGFQYSEYKNFELDIKSLAGESIKGGQTVYIDDINKVNNFRELDLVTIHNLKRFIAAPIPEYGNLKSLSGTFSQRYLGVMCFYPNSDIEVRFIERLINVIGKTYEYSVTSDRSIARNDIVNNSLRGKDLNSSLHNILEQISSKWNIEAASVFILDPRNDLLTMRATTGVNSGLKLLERHYRLDELQYKTVKSFLSESVLTTVNGEQRQHKFPEKIKSVFKSVMYIPIFEPSGSGINDEKHIYGVLRCVNRLVKRNKRIEVCHHGWEDASLLLFIAEIIGVIGHILKRSDDSIINFERAMHGINKPIHTAKTRIKSTQKYLLSKGLLKPPFENYMKDSISYLDALEWQVKKHAVRENYKDIKIYEVELFGEVISKILAFMDEIYSTYNVKSFTRNRIDYLNMPKVLGNEKALQVVFRNLVENAMKYTAPNKRCHISIDWWTTSQFLFVKVQDEGIGIEHKDVSRVFDEGYRSLEAMRLEPTGTGIGLADSRTIMRSMKGNIYLEKRKSPTIFVVKLKLARETK